MATETLKRIALGLRDRRGRILKTRSILVEKSARAFAELAAFAEAKRKDGEDVIALFGEFESKIAEVIDLIGATGANPFKFVLLDPTGWKDIPMASLAPLLNDRSCEVLVNLMTSDITRFLEQDDRAKSYNALFGRPGVLEILRQIPTGTGEVAECAVREYCKSLKQLCGFKFVSSAVVLEPNAEAIRYFLVYGTNHHRGVEVFKSAEMKAAKIQDKARSQAKARKTKQTEFGFTGEFSGTAVVHALRAKYLCRARSKIHDILRGSGSHHHAYRDLYCEAMAFPLVARSDLNRWIEELAPAVEIRLHSPNRRVLSLDHDDFVVVSHPDAISV